MVGRLVEAGLAIAAIIVVGLLVKRELLPSVDADEPDAPIRPLASADATPPRDRAIGATDAPVTIVVFTDFQCVACGSLHTELLSLQRVHGASLAVTYRHLPSTVHPTSVVAANAAECAAAQGRFAEFSTALFEGQHWIGLAEWDEFRRTANVPDSLAFGRCLGDRTGLPRIREDVRIARSAGVTGTPSVILDRTLLSGAGLEELSSRVRRLVEETRAP